MTQQFGEANEIQMRWYQFFSPEEPTQFSRKIHHRVQSMIDGWDKKTETRIISINVEDILEWDASMYRGLMDDALEYFPPLERVLTQIIDETHKAPTHPLNHRKMHREVQISLVGAFGRNRVSPRELDHTFLHKMVSVEGVVTRTGSSHPQLSHAVYHSPEDNTLLETNTPDGLSLSTYGLSSTAAPLTHNDQKVLIPQYGHSMYFDMQYVTLQELPERTPTGRLPVSCIVVMKRSYVDRVKPGDRVKLNGCYIARPQAFTTHLDGYLKTILVVNNVEHIDARLDNRYTTEDREEVREFCHGTENALHVIGDSIAPSVYGHQDAKQSIACMLAGGNTMNLASGSFLRGNINIMLIGDPSTAKSQLCRFVLKVAPLAVSTTGKSSTGVGLTASVGVDPESGERKLEAGAMVLADQGVVVIDEFDKMSAVDQVALHEVMEQQTVTITKAGIHTELNARCSVLAAANPVAGHYAVELPPEDNISLPRSLLSRFDLIWVIVDRFDKNLDYMIAGHILDVHCGKFKAKRGDLDIDFLKKLFHFTRQLKPKLTRNAMDYLKNRWVNMRARDRDQVTDKKFLPLTPRSLEALIRLAESVAKLRFSEDKVELKDAEEAVRLFQTALKSADVKRAMDDTMVADLELKQNMRSHKPQAEQTAPMDRKVQALPETVEQTPKKDFTAPVFPMESDEETDEEENTLRSPITLTRQGAAALREREDAELAAMEEAAIAGRTRPATTHEYVERIDSVFRTSESFRSLMATQCTVQQLFEVYNVEDDTLSYEDFKVCLHVLADKKGSFSVIGEDVYPMM
ncbi:hypothetical protein PCE1_001380 [Barthelona sp. PCE]